jgi:hypothetical protein
MPCISPTEICGLRDSFLGLGWADSYIAAMTPVKMD